MPFMTWVKTPNGYKPVEITDEEMVAENARRRGKRAEIWLDEANEMEKREKDKKMEFDKSRIYTALNADELKQGDKVIVANTMANLREDVQKGINIDVLKEVHGEDCLSRFIVKEGWYPLAYLVERKENCTNCGKGKWDAEHKKILCDPVQCANGKVVFGNHEIEVCEYWKPKTEQKAEHKCETCKYVNCGFKDFNTKNECDRWEAEVKAEHKCEDCIMDEICVEGKKIYKDAPCPYHRAEPHYRPFKDTDELIKVFCEKTPKIYGKDDEKLFMPYIWVRNKENKRVWLITEFDNRLLDYLFTNCEFLDGSPCGVEE